MDAEEQVDELARARMEYVLAAAAVDYGVRSGSAEVLQAATARKVLAGERLDALLFRRWPEE